MSGSRSKKSGPNRQPDSCKNARGGMLGRAICSMTTRKDKVDKTVKDSS